ncbi:MAG: hypothetical protein JNL10_18930 [Verrucomicrobiales bacterium]|nr:hypothetical protein [Verrucomicrobiales bacterium]
MSMLSRLLLLFVVLAGAPAPADAAPTNFWFSPDGKGDGTSRERPRSYTADFVQWRILHGVNGQSHDVVMHFLPGEYLVESFNTITTEPSDWRIRIVGHGRNPEDVVLKLKTNYPWGGSMNGSGWVNVIDLGRNAEYLERFEMENLTVDGNWDGQSEMNHPAYLRGYKNCPVSVSSRTGRIRRVIVRNFGAHGVLPQKSTDLSAGVEVFPIGINTREEGQAPEDGDPRPWVIEDCEVAGFRQYYNGYTTCLICVARLNVPNTPPWAWEDTARRLVWFRRNQVRGVPGGPGVIAFGAAGLGTNYTGKITWSDNVVLNATVFNTDTGAIRHVDVTNCLGLDIFSVGYVGTHSTRSPFMEDYSVNGNGFRFGGTLSVPNFRDYVVTNKPGGGLALAPDPSPVLGSLLPATSAGLKFQGIAKDIQYSGNWFTSRSREEFGSLHPLFARDTAFRIAYRMPAKDPETSNAPVYFRADPLNVDLTGNRISSVPFDFEDMKLLEGGKYATLSGNASPLLEKREALETKGTFQPGGRIQRVDMVFTNVDRRITWKGVPPRTTNAPPVVDGVDGTDRVLIGAVEIVAGRPTARDAQGNFRLPVRVAFQPTPRAGVSGTVPLAGRRVFMEFLPGSLNPRTLSAETGPDGLATFPLRESPDDNGVDDLRIWTDAGNGRAGDWDEFQDAWATTTLEHGCTVAVVVETSVADADRDHPARLRLRRSGPEDRALSVRLELVPGPHAATVGKEFRITTPSRGYPGGRPDGDAEVGATVEIPKGQRDVLLKVNPILENVRSGNLVRLRVVPGAGYGPGQPAEGEVVIYREKK